MISRCFFVKAVRGGRVIKKVENANKVYGDCNSVFSWLEVTDSVGSIKRTSLLPSRLSGFGGHG